MVMVRDVLAPWFAFCEGGEVLCEYEVAAAADCEVAAFWMADWARKAARKLEKKGRFDDILAGDLGGELVLWRSACIQRRSVGCARSDVAGERNAVATVEGPLAVCIAS